MHKYTEELFFFCVALPVLAVAFPSSSWMYSLLFSRAAGGAGLEHKALWMVITAATDYPENHVMDNKQNHKCVEIFLLLFLGPSGTSSVCHLSVHHIVSQFGLTLDLLSPGTCWF